MNKILELRTIFRLSLPGHAGEMQQAHSVAPRSGGMRLPEAPRRLESSRLSVVALKTFQKWRMKHGSMPGQRIETLDPAVLDSILAEFLATVKKQDDSEYRPNSLRTLRQGIDFYLKDAGYPLSIVTSPEFRSSQAVYKKRIELLTLKASHTDT